MKYTLKNVKDGCGAVILDSHKRIVAYVGGADQQGTTYHNFKAWGKKNAVVYIPEYGFNEPYGDEYDNDEAKKKAFGDELWAFLLEKDTTHYAILANDIPGCKTSDFLNDVPDFSIKRGPDMKQRRKKICKMLARELFYAVDWQWPETLVTEGYFDDYNEYETDLEARMGFRMK
jgi:hypothetical protein